MGQEERVITQSPLFSTAKTTTSRQSSLLFGLLLATHVLYLSEYASGADILMQDVYPFGNNVTFSSEWNTRCTTTFGDCG